MELFIQNKETNGRRLLFKYEEPIKSSKNINKKELNNRCKNSKDEFKSQDLDLISKIIIKVLKNSNDEISYVVNIKYPDTSNQKTCNSNYGRLVLWNNDEQTGIKLFNSNLKKIIAKNGSDLNSIAKTIRKKSISKNLEENNINLKDFKRNLDLKLKKSYSFFNGEYNKKMDYELCNNNKNDIYNHSNNLKLNNLDFLNKNNFDSFNKNKFKTYSGKMKFFYFILINF